VTVDHIKEVMNKYINGKKKVVLEYLPEAMKAGPPKKPAPPASPAKKENKP
jgi:hypothetical protein